MTELGNPIVFNLLTSRGSGRFDIIKSVSPAQIASLSAAEQGSPDLPLSAMEPTQIRALRGEYLTEHQLNGLGDLVDFTDKTIQRFSADQIGALSPTVQKDLSAKALRGMTSGQLKALDGANLTAGVLNDWNEYDSHRHRDMIRSFAPKQIAAMPQVEQRQLSDSTKTLMAKDQIQAIGLKPQDIAEPESALGWAGRKVGERLLDRVNSVAAAGRRLGEGLHQLKSLATSDLAPAPTPTPTNERLGTLDFQEARTDGSVVVPALGAPSSLPNKAKRDLNNSAKARNRMPSLARAPNPG